VHCVVDVAYARDDVDDAGDDSGGDVDDGCEGSVSGVGRDGWEGGRDLLPAEARLRSSMVGAGSGPPPSRGGDEVGRANALRLKRSEETVRNCGKCMMWRSRRSVVR
jgi:hypothetical protein